jgi:hypothetical protein
MVRRRQPVSVFDLPYDPVILPASVPILLKFRSKLGVGYDFTCDVELVSPYRFRGTIKVSRFGWSNGRHATRGPSGTPSPATQSLSTLWKVRTVAARDVSVSSEGQHERL